MSEQPLRACERGVGSGHRYELSSRACGEAALTSVLWPLASLSPRPCNPMWIDASKMASGKFHNLGEEQRALHESWDDIVRKLNSPDVVRNWKEMQRG